MVDAGVLVLLPPCASSRLSYPCLLSDDAAASMVCSCPFRNAECLANPCLSWESCRHTGLLQTPVKNTTKEAKQVTGKEYDKFSNAVAGMCWTSSVQSATVQASEGPYSSHLIVLHLRTAMAIYSAVHQMQTYVEKLFVTTVPNVTAVERTLYNTDP